MSQAGARAEQRPRAVKSRSIFTLVKATGVPGQVRSCEG